jgi:hypothetical protein
MASIQTLAAAALAFVVAIVITAVGTKIVSDIGATINLPEAREVTSHGIDALKVLAQWAPLLAMVIVATVIIVLLVRGLSGGFGGGE